MDEVSEMAATDAEEVKEILSVISTEIPKLLSAISETLFNAEQTEQYAKAVADFYQRLTEAGMDQEQAFLLTQQFMDKTNFAAMIQDVLGSKGFKFKGGKRRKDQEIGEAIEEAVKEKIKERFEESDEE